MQNFHLAALSFLAGADCVWRLLEFVSLQLAKDVIETKATEAQVDSGFLCLFGHSFFFSEPDMCSMCNPTLSARGSLISTSIILSLNMKENIFVFSFFVKQNRKLKSTHSLYLSLIKALYLNF